MIELPEYEVLVITQTNFPEGFAGPQGLGGIIARRKADGTFKVRLRYPSGDALEVCSKKGVELPYVVEFFEGLLRVYYNAPWSEPLPPLTISHSYPPSGASPEEFVAWVRKNNLADVVENGSGSNGATYRRR